MEVKGDSIPLPTAMHHPWDIQNAFRGQLSCPGVAVVDEGNVPSEQDARSSLAAHSSSWVWCRECPQSSPCAAGAGQQGGHFLPLYVACPKPQMSVESLISPHDCTAH